MPTPSESFSLRAIAVGAFGPSLLFGLGQGAILPVIPLTARELGAPVPVAAFIVALIGIGSLVSNVPASLVTIRWGERWAIVGAAIWCAVAMAICFATHDLRVFAAGCFAVGMAQSVFFLARQSYLSEAVPIAFRARALSTLGGVMRIGMFIGPFLSAAVIHQFGTASAYAVGTVALLGAGLLAGWIREPSPPPVGTAPAAAPATMTATAPGAATPAAQPSAPTLWSTVRDHRRIFATLGVAVILVSAVRASRQAVIPLWADQLGLAPSAASLIYGLSGGVDMLLFYPAGKLMDLKGRRFVAVPAMLIMGVALLLTPLTHGATTLLLAALAIGFGNGIGSGMIMTLGADHSPSPGRAHFLGVWRLMSDIGGSCGPALLSLLAASASLAVGVAVTGLLALAAAAQLAYWIPRVGPGRPL